MAVRTYLEMRDPAAFRPAPAPPEDVEVRPLHACPASFWRYLYAEVGKSHHWIDRLGWSDAEIRRYLDDPAVELWLLTVDRAPAGYFELRREPEGAIEIAYFGLLPEFIGRGLGKYLLSVATARAWDAGASRVWLHTNTLDHPAALPNYLARGFVPFRSEEFTAP
jgi:GNAT superfamily N-acetyltransferase